MRTMSKQRQQGENEKIPYVATHELLKNLRTLTASGTLTRKKEPGKCACGGSHEIGIYGERCFRMKQDPIKNAKNSYHTLNSRLTISSKYGIATHKLMELTQTGGAHYATAQAEHIQCKLHPLMPRSRREKAPLEHQ